MSTPFMPDAITVIVRDGTTFVMSPNGDILAKLTGVTLVDNYNDIPTVTITLYCNVEGSELTANQKYKAAALEKLRYELAKHAEKLEKDNFQNGGPFRIGDLVTYDSEAGPATGRVTYRAKDSNEGPVYYVRPMPDDTGPEWEFKMHYTRLKHQ